MSLEYHIIINQKQKGFRDTLLSAKFGETFTFVTVIKGVMYIIRLSF